MDSATACEGEGVTMGVKDVRYVGLRREHKIGS